MYGSEKLSSIRDTDCADNIRDLTRRLAAVVQPMKIFLFGSFANGTYTDESDFDFYIVIDDGRNVSEAADSAYNSITEAKKRPVDIVIGTLSGFERKSGSPHSLMIEGEVQRNGILLYDRSEESAVKAGA